MTTVADVAEEVGVAADTVLAACRDLGIVASSPRSGLSRSEHTRLRDALGASSDLPAVVGGSTDRHPDAPRPPDPRSLQERHAALRAESRTRRISPATAVRIAVYAFLLVAVAVAVVVLRSRGDESTSDLTTFTETDEGTCVQLSESGGRSRVDPVSCRDPHDAELYAVGTVDGGSEAPFPGTEALTAQADRECGERFAPYVGRPYADSVLDVVFLVPTPQTWSIGDRTIVCLVEDPAGPLTGTVRDADR